MYIHTDLVHENVYMSMYRCSSLPPSLLPPSLGCLLAHDDRPQLAVVSDQNHLLSPQHYRNHALWFCGLGREGGGREEEREGERVRGREAETIFFVYIHVHVYSQKKHVHVHVHVHVDHLLSYQLSYCLFAFT